MVIRSGLHMVSPNRVHRWRPRPAFHTAGLSWLLAGGPWPGFHLAGPSHGPSHGGPHAGHQTADPRSMGSGRAFTRWTPAVSSYGRPSVGGPLPGLHTSGPSRASIKRTQSGFYMSGHSRTFI